MDLCHWIAETLSSSCLGQRHRSSNTFPRTWLWRLFVLVPELGWYCNDQSSPELSETRKCLNPQTTLYPRNSWLSDYLPTIGLLVVDPASNRRFSNTFVTSHLNFNGKSWEITNFNENHQKIMINRGKPCI